MRLCFKTKVRFSDALLVSHRIIQRQRMQNILKFTFMLSRQHNLYTYDAVACARVTRASEVASQCRNGATQVQSTQ